MGIELEDEVEVRPRNPDDAPSILLDPSKTESDFDWRRGRRSKRRREGRRLLREHGVAETFTHLKQLDAPNPVGR